MCGQLCSDSTGDDCQLVTTKHIHTLHVSYFSCIHKMTNLYEKSQHQELMLAFDEIWTAMVPWLEDVKHDVGLSVRTFICFLSKVEVVAFE